MTDRLAKLADLAYRRRGRMVAAWLMAALLIIGLGSSLAGEYSADYDTPGSESAAARDITEREFGGFTAQQLYVVWRDPAGAARPQARERIEAFLTEAKKVDHVAAETPVRVSDDGTIATTTLPLTAPGW
jgi:putative drug exporter of the RND superfamily